MRHESKCANVHGHRYTVEVTCRAAALDEVGRVIDFGVVKGLLGPWVDQHLDHGYIHHPDDPVARYLRDAGHKCHAMPDDTPEPTAENLASLLAWVAADLLGPHGVAVVAVRIYETPNCWADWRADPC
jgi:6-pyruvoyltetrahydropterin/6-carboxytetrahydropterin synthase